MIFASIAFKKSAPNSASDSDAATNFSMWHRVNIAPLRWTGCLSCDVHPSDKIMSGQLHASLSDKYEAYECTLRIMSD